MVHHVSRALPVAALALFACSPAARAQLVYDNGGPNQSNGNEMTAWIQAENFTLAAPTTLTDVRFWDAEVAPGYTGSINWGIYSDATGSPGTLLSSGNQSVVSHVATGVTTAFGYPEFQNDFSIGSVALGSGTYWLGLHNGPLTVQSRNEMYWETTSQVNNPTGHELIAPFTGGWSDNGQEHAFALFSNTTAVTPEPGSLALLVGMGVTGAGFLARRKRVRK